MLVAFAPSNEFQSTLPRGERLLHKLCIGLLSYISIHAPARGATPLLLCITLGYRISIHAPARGATEGRNRNTKSKVISIHAPARGATRDLYYFGLSTKDFNPRSREGSDDCKSPPLNPNLRISIHAPARGATFFPNFNSIYNPYFNPRSREGSDAIR